MLIGCLYLPNGNPQPGSKFDYKLAWFEQLIDQAAALFATEVPVVLADGYNVRADRFGQLLDQDMEAGRTDPPEVPSRLPAPDRTSVVGADRTLHPDQPMYTSWDYTHDQRPRDGGLRLDHLLLNLASTR